MTGEHMLQPHDLLPHFEVADLGGERVSYSSIWQRKNLVLAMLPDSDPPSRNYADRLMAKVRGLSDDDTECIVTRDPIEGLPRPGVVVADQWGEIAHVVQSSHVEDLPPADELIEWVRYLQYRCPECEGEAK
jgi:peroxiredoxin